MKSMVVSFLISCICLQAIVADPWMSRLADSVPVDSITIPGTHDSAAYNTLLVWAKTQDMSLSDQLNNGIRFLDIRCRHINNKFTIHHGAVYLKMNFDDVLNKVIDFLTQNPTETVLMQIKEAYIPMNNTRSFEETIREYYYNQRYNSFFWNWNTDTPTLGETRKRIVVLQDFVTSGARLGLLYNSFNIQDKYETNNYTFLSTNNYNDKKKSIKDQVDNAKNQKRIINYLSAVGKGTLILFATPGAVASVTNAYIKSLIYQNPYQYFGILVADFPDKSLIDLVISRNPLGSIFSGQVLTSENYLQSPNGRYKAIFKNPGEFYVFDAYKNTRIWQALNNPEGKMWAVKMQQNGNLVMYNDYWRWFRTVNDPYWASDTSSCLSGVLKYELNMQDDGNLVIYAHRVNAGVMPIWTSMSFVDKVKWRVTSSNRNCPK